MAEADDHPTAPQRNWLDLNRRERRRLREANIRAVEAYHADRQRPGSNIPPITDAEIAAYEEQLRYRLTAALKQAHIMLPDALPLVRQILVSQRRYIDGANVVDVALQQITALVRHVDHPGSVLHETDALEPTRIVLKALADALSHNLANLRALLPKLENLDGKRWLGPDEMLRGTAAAGIAGLTKGGGISQPKAAELVSDAFRAEGVTLTPKTALQHFKRLRRAHINHTDADPAATKLYADLCARFPPSWPLATRKEWLHRIAATAARHLGT